MKKYRFQIKTDTQLYAYYTEWVTDERGQDSHEDIGQHFQDLLNSDSGAWFGFMGTDGYRIVRKDDIEYFLLEVSHDD